MHWHLKLRGYVLWCGRLSSSFYVKSGVRQGGINSPWFFNFYINDLIVTLRNSGYGCYSFVDILGSFFSLMIFCYCLVLLFICSLF